MSLDWYSQGVQKIEDPLKDLTEMCDVCGKDIPVRETQGVVWTSPTGTKFVIRKHLFCDIQQITKYLS